MVQNQALQSPRVKRHLECLQEVQAVEEFPLVEQCFRPLKLLPIHVLLRRVKDCTEMTNLITIRMMGWQVYQLVNFYRPFKGCLNAHSFHIYCDKKIVSS